MVPENSYYKNTILLSIICIYLFIYLNIYLDIMYTINQLNKYLCTKNLILLL